MGQSPYFASPTPRSFRRVFNIVSKAVSQSISPPPPAAGGFFDSVPGLGEDRTPNDSDFADESGGSLSGVCVGGFQGWGSGIGPSRGPCGRGPDWPGPGWGPIPGGGRGGPAPNGLGGAMGRCSPGLPGPCMTNERGPPCVGGIGGLMGMGPGRGIPCGGGEPGVLVDPDCGVHLVGSGGRGLFPEVLVNGGGSGPAWGGPFDGTAEDCEL